MRVLIYLCGYYVLREGIGLDCWILGAVNKAFDRPIGCARYVSIIKCFFFLNSDLSLSNRLHENRPIHYFLLINIPQFLFVMV